MKFIRKALLPAVIAAGFLGFLGAIGPSTPSVSAAPGDICSVTGPLFIEEGGKADYTVVVENGFEDGDEVDVDLNDFNGGDSDITSINGAPIAPTDFLNDEDLSNAGNVCGDTATSSPTRRKPPTRRSSSSSSSMAWTTVKSAPASRR